jgi:excinuclease ABC subunit A
MLDIEEVQKLDKNKTHTIDVVVDRLMIKPGIRNRLADSVELALAQSEGTALVQIVKNTVPSAGDETIPFTENAVCPDCGISIPETTPASFSFNSPHGACPACDGLGATTTFDPDLIIPNKSLSLREGAVAPWAKRTRMHFIEFMDALTRHYGVDIFTPYKELPTHFQNVLLYGSDGEDIAFYFEQNDRRYYHRKPFEGIIPNLQRRYSETDSNQIREEIKAYISFHPCGVCQGAKLNKHSLGVLINGLNISEITAFSIGDAQHFFKELAWEGQKEIISKKIVEEIEHRLRFLENVGLGYLTLNRAAHTLSGGESQRIRLATQIGSKLTGVMYVLDEPSIGLHQRDNQRLLSTLLEMRDMGNTVLVVEHDEETILSADQIVDMGPGAGIHGGHVVFSGPPEKLLDCKDSLTGQYLSGKKTIPIPEKRRPVTGRKMTIHQASENNLKHIDVDFPLGAFIGVTGVSGSGKSTLIIETLFNGIYRHLNVARIRAGAHEKITGLHHVDKIVNIDQNPIGRTPRSNPGTYTGVFAFIRELFAKTPEARVRGYKPGRFSFNVKGGRCEACTGDGVSKIEMHFLPDIYVTCDVCRGSRYNRETLEIRYKGKNIADVLDMTVNQALAFFLKIGNIRSKLQTLVDVGLGYIRLGQPATTLSGGEAQRVKLARELSKKGTGGTVYILDEPTTGLHVDDIRKLLMVLNRLVDAGNTVIVIEHNMDVIKTVDYIIALGPEGGDEGGHVIGTGTPEQVSNLRGSHTGRFLKPVLAGGEPKPE